MNGRPRSAVLGVSAALVFACITALLSFPASASSESTAQQVAAAKKVVASSLQPPTSLPVNLLPLPKKPPVKTLAWLNCNDPSCLPETQGAEAATKALGWHINVINEDLSNPAPALQQAINEKPNYIGMIALSAAQVPQQIQAAKAAGIPILNCSGTDLPQPSVNDEYMDCGGLASFQKQTFPIVNWVTATSNGKAHFLDVTVSALPSLVAQEHWLKTNLADVCTTCTFQQLDLPLSDLGTNAIPGIVVAYLQTHPDINYIQLGDPSMLPGLTPALSAANFSKVKIVGIVYNTAVLQGIINGTLGAWQGYPTYFNGWLEVDTAARMADGMKLTQVAAVDANVPRYLVQSPAVAKKLLNEGGGYWPGPTNFEAKLEQLWHA